MDTIAWLEKLVSEDTVSRESNLSLIRLIEDYLNSLGVESNLTFNDAGTKANLHAVIGPTEIPGIMLSGHTDVVPVDGQNWTSDPFVLRKADNRYFGRGTADMKGFIACVLAMVPSAVKADLARPLHLAFSYDEEIGCIGVRRMIDVLETAPIKPAFCIIGEPTEMGVAIAHKGKTGAICTCRGVEAHSALAPTGLNAIYLASEMIAKIRELQEEIIAENRRDEGFSVPYTTLHVGTIDGGTALNIVPKECRFRFEIRNLPKENPGPLMARLVSEAESICGQYRAAFPDANIGIEVFNEYPALDTDPESEIVAFVKSLTGKNDHFKVAFGTEGGLFQKRLGMPTIICGPGSMEQGHKPDEFIAQSQLQSCDRFLARLLETMKM